MAAIGGPEGATAERRTRAAVAVVVLLTTATLVGVAGMRAVRLLGWQATAAGPVVTVRDSYGTPEETVVAYLQAVARHDRSALVLLDPGLRTAYGDSPDSDFANVRSLTRPVVTSGAQPVRMTGYPTAVEVAVSYDAVFGHVVASENGRQARLVVLAREGGAPAGPWRILRIVVVP